MNGPWAFVAVLLLLAVWPLVLVGLFSWQRRSPSGMPPQHRWMFWGAVALIYLGSAVFFLATGAAWRGILFLAASVAAGAHSLDQRRRSTFSGKA